MRLKFLTNSKFFYIFDDFVRLLHESRLRVALRVLVLIRLRIRQRKFVVFRGTRLRSCFQFNENGLSFGKRLRGNS